MTVLASLLRVLGLWAERGARTGGGSASLILVRLSDRLMRMSSSLTPSPRPAAGAPPETVPVPPPAAPPAPRPASPWRAVRVFGLTVLWTWRVATAPIRLIVWVAEAVVTLTMAAVIVGAAAWAMGLIPDETVLRLARPLMERLGGFVVHGIEQVLQNRSGG